MKTCQTAQKTFHSIGISTRRISFGLRELIHILGYILYITFIFIYVMRGTETASEQAKVIPLILGSILILVFYLTFKFKSETIFHIFDEIEQTVNQSE